MPISTKAKQAAIRCLMHTAGVDEVTAREEMDWRSLAAIIDEEAATANLEAPDDALQAAADAVRVRADNVANFFSDASEADLRSIATFLWPHAEDARRGRADLGGEARYERFEDCPIVMLDDARESQGAEVFSVIAMDNGWDEATIDAATAAFARGEAFTWNDWTYTLDERVQA